MTTNEDFIRARAAFLSRAVNFHRRNAITRGCHSLMSFGVRHSLRRRRSLWAGRLCSVLMKRSGMRGQKKKPSRNG